MTQRERVACLVRVVALLHGAFADDKAGVLILSEFTGQPNRASLVSSTRSRSPLFSGIGAGAAQSLGAGAISVNPWDINNAADAIRYVSSVEPSCFDFRHDVLVSVPGADDEPRGAARAPPVRHRARPQAHSAILVRYWFVVEARLFSSDDV